MIPKVGDKFIFPGMSEEATIDEVRYCHEHMSWEVCIGRDIPCNWIHWNE